jgi:hypothetical protein
LSVILKWILFVDRDSEGGMGIESYDRGDKRGGQGRGRGRPPGLKGKEIGMSVSKVNKIKQQALEIWDNTESHCTQSHSHIPYLITSFMLLHHKTESNMGNIKVNTGNRC